MEFFLQGGKFALPGKGVIASGLVLRFPTMYRIGIDTQTPTGFRSGKPLFSYQLYGRNLVIVRVTSCCLGHVGPPSLTVLAYLGVHHSWGSPSLCRLCRLIGSLFHDRINKSHLSLRPPLEGTEAFIITTIKSPLSARRPKAMCSTRNG